MFLLKQVSWLQVFEISFVIYLFILCEFMGTTCTQVLTEARKGV